MTLCRVVALAQALTMIMLLLPGPLSTGPALVQAALRPAEPEAVTVYDAEGKGIGCQTGSKKYKGPGLPKDPPWPPGAEPTPSPQPTPSPEPSAAADPSASTVPEPEAVVMAFAAGELDVVQGELEVTQAAPAATPRPKSRLITGIDVSHHQEELDFSAVKDAGHHFVLMKVTENNDHLDTRYASYLPAARAEDLVVGAYHVLDYTLDGKAQADHYVDRVEAVAGFDGLLAPIVDVECWAYYGASIQSVSAARLRDFIEQVYRRTGLEPIVYTSAYMWSQVVGDAAGFEDLSLWTACWGCSQPITLPEGWDAWTFWQYTEGGTRIPGRKKPVDGNFFFGTRKELKALRTAPVAISGSAASSGGTVGLDLGGRSGTHYRTSPDGQTWSDWSRLGGTPVAEVPATEGSYTVFVQLKNGPGLKSPVFRDTAVIDDTPPELTPPSVSLRTGAMGPGGATIPVSVRWDARDVTAGLADARVAVSCGEGQQQRTEAPGHAEPGELVTWQAEAWLFPSGSCDVTAIAVDGAGNTDRATAPGAVARFISTTGDPARASLDGSQAGLVARRGPDGGRAALQLDGAAVALIDLYAPEATGPEVVHVLDLDPGEHTLSVEPIDSSDPSSGGLDVVVEGFVSLVR